jgi:hypothetical protein
MKFSGLDLPHRSISGHNLRNHRLYIEAKFHFNSQMLTADIKNVKFIFCKNALFQNFTFIKSLFFDSLGMGKVVKNDLTFND